MLSPTKKFLLSHMTSTSRSPHSLSLSYREQYQANIMKNVSVKESECCLDVAKKALNLIDSRDFDYVSVKHGKSLEIPVIAACAYRKKRTNKEFMLFYLVSIKCCFTLIDSN